MAGYVIYTPAHLPARAIARAEQLGPSAVWAAVALPEFARGAGFTVVEMRDVTEAFHRTTVAFTDGLSVLEPELRAAEGDAEYEDEWRRKSAMRRGIEEQVLRRCLLVLHKAAVTA